MPEQNDLHMVKPVDALWPMPRAPEPGFLRKPAPVREPGGRSFWMKFTTTIMSVLDIDEYKGETLTDSAGSIVTEALDELDGCDSPSLPWNSTSYTRKGGPFFLGRERAKEVCVVVESRVGGAGV
jgi:hypothetical protein